LVPEPRHKHGMSLQMLPSQQNLRRSILCLPAFNERAIAKLATLDCDAVILDLEDSVAPDMKETGRRNILSYMAGSGRKDHEIIIRVNEVGSQWHTADMALALALEPDAILLPKVRKADDILSIADYLDEKSAPESLRIWAMMETSHAILHAGSIAETGRTKGGRLDCLVVGLNDLRKETGVPAEPERRYLAPWLMQVVLAGRAFGLSVIDSVSNDFRNLEPFEAECRQGRAMGFDGKMLIHPAQIEAANRVFSPSETELAEARAIVEAFSNPETHSKGAININGKMVERLHLASAENLLKRAEMIVARRIPR
jgi:citrate lyase subunit beta/citryl-CoA lyase